MATQLDYCNTRSRFLAHRLRMARQDCDYTQEYVAHELGLRSSTISSYENGYTSPDYDRLIPTRKNKCAYNCLKKQWDANSK